MTTTLLALLLTVMPLNDETMEGRDRQSDAEIEAARARIESDFRDARAVPETKAERIEIPAKYDYLDPDHVVPTDLLEAAVVYFDLNLSRFQNQNYLIVVDFKPRSDNYRFFLIDLKTGGVERYHTTHGVGSDTDNDGYAESFGNVPDSGKSSLGFIRTAEVYYGNYRRSIRLDGLSPTNSNVRRRAIVFHGWDNVKEQDVIQGRSRGCITLDWTVKDAVLDKIKEGALMYIGVAK